MLRPRSDGQRAGWYDLTQCRRNVFQQSVGSLEPFGSSSSPRATLAVGIDHHVPQVTGPPISFRRVRTPVATPAAVRCPYIQFLSAPISPMPTPVNIDLKRDRGLTVLWDDGAASYYSIAYLRRMSPSADMRVLREEMARNPLTVLPSSGGGAGGGAGGKGALVATTAELVGNYAIRIAFSDGHDTGIYTWEYLRKIDPASPPPADESAPSA